MGPEEPAHIECWMNVKKNVTEHYFPNLITTEVGETKREQFMVQVYSELNLK